MQASEHCQHLLTWKLMLRGMKEILVLHVLGFMGVERFAYCVKLTLSSKIQKPVCLLSLVCVCDPYWLIVQLFPYSQQPSSHKTVMWYNCMKHVHVYTPPPPPFLRTSPHTLGSWLLTSLSSFPQPLTSTSWHCNYQYLEDINCHTFCDRTDWRLTTLTY